MLKKTYNILINYDHKQLNDLQKKIECAKKQYIMFLKQITEFSIFPCIIKVIPSTETIGSCTNITNADVGK